MGPCGLLSCWPGTSLDRELHLDQGARELGPVSATPGNIGHAWQSRGLTTFNYGAGFIECFLGSGLLCVLSKRYCPWPDCVPPQALARASNCGLE